MITNEIWDNLPDEIVNALIDIIATCWKHEYIPEDWKNIVMVLIPKTGDLRLLVNYRPIALCQCSYKIFTKVIQEMMLEHCDLNCVLNNFQFGGKKNASITQALLTYASVIDDARRHDKQLYILQLDLSKAFDTVTFFILERTLKFYRS